MRRNTNFARGSHVPAATLNAMQDEQSGLIAATDTAGGATAVALKGADGRWWTTPDVGVADATVRALDTSVDWRNRRIWGVFRNLGAANRRPGQASDHVPNDPTSAVATRYFEGWTGTGGLGAASAAVVDGTPPVLADNCFAVVADELGSSSDRVYLYADPTTHALCLYNDSGVTLHAELRVWGAGVAPTPGESPSSVIPTLTEVLWLDPGLAADRPSDPSGPAIYRSTDTGAIELWDGGAWRTFSGSAAPTATAAGQLQVSTGAGTAYVARGRVLSGTLAARDALATVYEGDQWLVSSGASAGTLWKRIDGAWQWMPLATSAAGWRSALGVPAQAAVLLLDGSQPMGGDLDMDGQIVKNLALATADGDAASKQYVDAAIATTVAAATTTDATETTCGTRAPADGTHVVRALVAASSGSVRIAWELIACVTVSGGAATLGYVAEATCTQDPAPYSVALDTSGDAVRVRVTGAASTTIAWAVSLYVSGA